MNRNYSLILSNTQNLHKIRISKKKIKFDVFLLGQISYDWKFSIHIGRNIRNDQDSGFAHWSETV